VVCCLHGQQASSAQTGRNLGIPAIRKYRARSSEKSPPEADDKPTRDDDDGGHA
jgi:hypothetical protein